MSWTSYTDRKPESAGAYRWRMESTVVAGMFVTFIAHMRTRGAGYENVLSPLFDYWDGYRVHVPAGLQWQPLRAEDPQDVEWHRVAAVEVEDLSPMPCPYCNRVPVLEGLQRYQGHSGCDRKMPSLYNEWSLKCCAWGNTPSYKSPIDLVERRDSVLRRISA